MSTKLRVILPALGLALAALPAHAETAGAAIQKVQFKQGVVLVTRDGKTAAAEEPFDLSGGIKVATNGTFRVQEGRERRFLEGDVLEPDGTLARLDGTRAPVIDHVTVKGGRPVLVRDGQPTPVSADLVLRDGTRITADGTVTPRNGGRRRLLDGELLRLDGGTLAVKDTVTLKQGRVVLQKDGARLELRPGQVMSMSDGTRVSADGSLVRRDGTRQVLREGEIVNLEGVTPARR